jgi:hypothetical protein
MNFGSRRFLLLLGKRFCVACGKLITGKRRRTFCSRECGIMGYPRTEEQKFQLLALAKQRKVDDPIDMKILYECKCKSKHKENHHFDYSRPTEVIRLCSSCHKIEHRRRLPLMKKLLSVEE